MFAAFGRPSTLALAALTCLLAACSSPPSQAEGATKADDKDGQAPPAPTGPEYVHAEAGEVVALVRAARTQALADDRQLVVYVGASWCEPCQYFHAAVDDGRLDAVFPKLRLLEFDLDQDRERLVAAGYRSKMIPLFVVPDAEGKPSPHRLEGSVKGEAAIENLRGRLEPVLQAAAADGLF